MKTVTINGEQYDVPDAVAEELERRIKWRHRSTHSDLFRDGEQYLIAVPLSRGGWDFEVWSVSCDAETPAEFYDPDGNDVGWGWTDVEWYVRLSSEKSRPPSADAAREG